MEWVLIGASTALTLAGVATLLAIAGGGVGMRAYRGAAPVLAKAGR